MSFVILVFQSFYCEAAKAEFNTSPQKHECDETKLGNQSSQENYNVHSTHIDLIYRFI